MYFSQKECTDTAVTLCEQLFVFIIFDLLKKLQNSMKMTVRVRETPGL